MAHDTATVLAPGFGFRIGGACSGYGGLEMAAVAGLGGQVVWHAESDPFASRVLAHHWPTVPNLGDITRVDWTRVPGVDVLCAGFPCTDISNAGRKAGIGGKRSGIWKNVAAAVRDLRPRLVLLENVAALRRRGLDVVVGDLAALGYDARWTCLRAGDPETGAPHPRDRWFAVAYPALSHPDAIRWDRGPGDIVQASGRDEPAHRGNPAPTPAAAPVLSLLPTPAARDWKSGASNLLGRNSRPLNEFAVNMLSAVRTPDPRWIASNGTDYGPAIRRWEHLTGRPAPAPTEPGTRRNRRLSPLFTEWLMGLPEGHVTALDLPRAEQLKILGNGAVPQHAMTAYPLLLNPRAHLTATDRPALTRAA